MSDLPSINAILEPHLFQVIGSTPASVRDSLMKVSLRNKPSEGGYMCAVAVFSSAVNKATLETFLSKAEFIQIRQMVSAALSIQNRVNMTAFTLLGHCIMTSKFADDITFVAEFRKKMGQNHLWDGNLESGSLSEKQKTILKEKKRVTDVSAAQALGNGYFKWVGLSSEPMTVDEAEFWGLSIPRQVSAPRQPEAARETVFPGASAGPSRIGVSSSVSARARKVSPDLGERVVPLNIDANTVVQVPLDVMNYRTNVLGFTLDDIAASIRDRGFDTFVARTRQAMTIDPDGSKTKAASTVGGKA